MTFDPRRRQYLKQAGIIVAGGALAACNSGADRSVGGPPDESPATARRQRFDQGEIAVRYSGWARTGQQVDEYPALSADLDTDFLVVGAGLAGSSLSLHLAELGARVVTLEARQPGWGASGRNAGHVLPVLRDLEVFKHFPDGGEKFLRLFDEHHTIPFDLSRQYKIDCDATQSGYLSAMRTREHQEDFTAESRYWEGHQDVIELGATDMQALSGTSYYPYGVLYPDGGRVNPYLFSNGMIRAAAQRGAQVFGNSEALAIRRSGNRWIVTTAAGQVTTSRVIFCTNAYPTSIVPQFANSFYPLTSYALATTPLPEELREVIMPGGQTLAQVPMDLNPLVIDEHHRLITASIPSPCRPMDAAWHFDKHLKWIHRVWPETQSVPIRMDSYWTGRVAMRDREFPGVYEVEPGLFGLMHFNAWGNVMAPLLGKLLAPALVADRMDQLPFPLERPEPVAFQRKNEILIRNVMIPLARTAQGFGFI